MSTPIDHTPAAPAEHPGLIRGQTSAHRGLRTFAQDRRHKRHDSSAVPPGERPTDDSGETPPPKSP